MDSGAAAQQQQGDGHTLLLTLVCSHAAEKHGLCAATAALRAVCRDARAAVDGTCTVAAVEANERNTRVDAAEPCFEVSLDTLSTLLQRLLALRLVEVHVSRGPGFPATHVRSIKFHLARALPPMLAGAGARVTVSAAGGWRFAADAVAAAYAGAAASGSGAAFPRWRNVHVLSNSVQAYALTAVAGHLEHVCLDVLCGAPSPNHNISGSIDGEEVRTLPGQGY
jgi:hypothetical protein